MAWLASLCLCVPRPNFALQTHDRSDITLREATSLLGQGMASVSTVRVPWRLGWKQLGLKAHPTPTHMADDFKDLMAQAFRAGF
jgi:hypothetical protein